MYIDADDDVVDNWFKTNLKSGAEIGLAFTCEEPIAKMMCEHVNFIETYHFLLFNFKQNSAMKLALKVES